MKNLITLSFLALTILPKSNAQITINVVGDGSGYDVLGTDTNEVAAYRSTGVTKTFDVDGDNVYGTEGVLAFGDGGGKKNKQPFRIHSQVGADWAAFSAGRDAWTVAQNHDASEPMDDPTVAVGSSVGNRGSVGMLTAKGMAYAGAWSELLKFEISADAPQRFRIALIAGTQFDPSGHWDPSGFRITANGGRTVATVTELENNGNGHANMVFFDVNLNGASSGTIEIWGQQNRSNPKRKMSYFKSPTGNNFIEGATLTAIAFDRIPDSHDAMVDIPEPRNYGLIAGWGALASVMLRRRRR